MDKQYIGYHLIRPYMPFTVAYVGIGKMTRPQEHIKAASKGTHDNLILQKIFNKVWRLGFKNLVTVVVSRHVTWEDACSWEREQIRSFGRLNLGTGYLANMTDGGDGCTGRKHRPEAIAAMQIAHKGAKAWNKGVPMSKEAKENLRHKNLGHPGHQWSEEEKKMLSGQLRGKKRSEKGAANIRAASAKRRGISLTTEHKQAIASATRRVLNEPSTKAKLLTVLRANAAKRKGVPRSEEVKAKISATLLARSNRSAVCGNRTSVHDVNAEMRVS